MPLKCPGHLFITAFLTCRGDALLHASSDEALAVFVGLRKALVPAGGLALLWQTLFSAVVPSGTWPEPPQGLRRRLALQVRHGAAAVLTHGQMGSLLLHRELYVEARCVVHCRRYTHAHTGRRCWRL